MSNLEFKLIKSPVDSNIDPLHKMWVANTPYGDYRIERMPTGMYVCYAPIAGGQFYFDFDSSLKYCTNVHEKILEAHRKLKELE